MDSFYLNEMLRILFLPYKKNSQQFASLFDDSETIAAFDYDTDKNEFIALSHSFNKFLGINLFSYTIKDVTLKKLIHPGDTKNFKDYFNIDPLTIKQSNKKSPTQFKRMKCRLLHSNGYFKYFVFVSFANFALDNNTMHQIGFIIDEMIGANLLVNKNNQMHYISKNNKNPNNQQLHITRRENEILEYIGKGLIAKEIAEKLNISVTTVISHRKNLINKFHVKNTAELIRQASRLMII